MKVTIACDVLGQPNNGTTIATLNLINYLKSKGHEVTVICGDSDKKCTQGYAVLPQMNFGPLINKIVAANDVSLAKPDKNIMYNAIKDADVVHVQFAFMIGQTAAKIATELGKPLTASFHCQAENFTTHLRLMNFGLANKITYNVFYNKVYKKCDCVHYPTQFIRDLFEGTTGKTNGYVISNGVASSFINKNLSRDNEKFTIVSTGRLSLEKAQTVLIRAVAKSKYKDKIKICFAGDGPLKKKYKHLAKHLNVDADFNFYSREELVALLNTANLYVHTAFIEIEAIACTEAICCGLVPVIANAKRSATKNFALDENNLFKENNSKDLAKKIDFWYENPELKKQYVERYKSMSGKFDQEECMEKMLGMLQDAIKKHEK